MDVSGDVLQKLSHDQRTLIISLPYRVGLWVSVSDDLGGEEASEKELTALNNLLIGFSQQVFGSEMLQYIMDETVSKKAQWDEWSNNTDAVPEECQKALDVLREHVDEKDVKAYSMRLMEIAEAVALAFREYEQDDFSNKLRIYGSYILNKMRAKMRKQPTKSFDQYLSISINERKALNALASAMDTQFNI